jgi:biopolymer transport protein ExbB/TolQ
MNNGYNSSCFGRFIVVLTLPLIFIVFIALNFFGIMSLLNIHTETFYILISIFIIFILFINHNAYIAECRIKKQFKITKNELEKSLDSTALEIEGQVKSVLSIRDFLEDYFKSIRNDNYSKVASSVFPMLGILGTFIAIAISMPDFTVTNSKQLDSEISKLLSGVGTAFYASIFGIFLSLLWTFFERVGLSKIEKLTRSLEDIYSKYIWSERELLKFKYNKKAIRDNELIRALKETFNLDFIKDINKEHLRSYESIIDKTNSGLKDIEASLVKQSSKLQSVANKMRQSEESINAKENLEKNIKEFNKSAYELNNLLNRFDVGLDSALTKVDSQLAHAVKEIEAMVISVKSLKE